MTIDEKLAAVAEAHPFDFYWKVEFADGRSFGRGERTILPAASVRKTSIMMAALRAAHQGRIDLSAPVEIKAKLQRDIFSGVTQYMTPGVVIPLRDAILLMMIVSDNVCTFEVMRPLELDELTDYCRGIGMVDTVHRTRFPPVGLPVDHALEQVTTTTAADQVLLLQLIQAGVEDPQTAARLGVTCDLCRLAMQFLTWQRLRNMIPALLPLGTVVAQKTGRGQRGWMDSGMVFRDGRPLFTLSATTDRVPDTMPDGLPGHAAATQSIARLARVCWDNA